MRHLKFVVNCALVFSSIGAFAQDSARTVQYHSQDIVPSLPLILMLSSSARLSRHSAAVPRLLNISSNTT